MEMFFKLVSSVWSLVKDLKFAAQKAIQQSSDVVATSLRGFFWACTDCCIRHSSALLATVF
jgi:hypothetical protein